MAYLEELLPEFRKGAKIRFKNWKKDEYICIKDGKVVNEKGSYLNSFYYGYLKSDNWELYQESIDWDYIIENKCLCWFWDEDENKEIENISTFLYAKPRKSNKFFIDIAGSNWKNCRPVRRDEVTFYEDKKNE